MDNARLKIHLFDKAPLCFAWMSILLCFLITRAPFWEHYYFPIWHPDTASYFGPLHQLMNGEWPLFDIRPPGYVFFLWPLIKINGIALIPVAQSIATLASSLILTAAVFRSHKALTIPTAFVAAFYLSSDTVINYDMTLLPESLYASGLVIFTALLFLLIKKQRPEYLYGLTLTTAIILLLRPAGLFLVVICLFLIVNYAVNRKAYVTPIFALLPVVIVILAACTYNRATTGSFDFVPFGAVSLAGATSTQWVEDPDLPETFNDFIRQHNATITAEDKAVLTTSWDHLLLYKVYSRYFDPTIGRGFLASQRHAEGYRTMKKMALIAIAEKPKDYIKFVTSQFIMFFRNSERELPFYNNLPTQFDLVLGSSYYNEIPNYEKYYLDFIKFMGMPSGYNIPRQNSMAITLKNTREKDLHEKFTATLALTLRGTLWIGVYFLILIAAVIVLVKSSFKNTEAFLLTSVGLIPLGAAALVAISQRGLQRYWYPSEFAFYLTIVLGAYSLSRLIRNQTQR